MCDLASTFCIQLNKLYTNALFFTRPSSLDKFSESFWRWSFYFSAHVLSVWFLASKPWVWNTFECWYGYPNHSLGKDISRLYHVKFEVKIIIYFRCGSMVALYAGNVILLVPIFHTIFRCQKKGNNFSFMVFKVELPL